MPQGGPGHREDLSPTRFRGPGCKPVQNNPAPGLWCRSQPGLLRAERHRKRERLQFWFLPLTSIFIPRLPQELTWPLQPQHRAVPEGACRSAPGSLCHISSAAPLPPKARQGGQNPAGRKGSEPPLWGAQWVASQAGAAGKSPPSGPPGRVPEWEAAATPGRPARRQRPTLGRSGASSAKSLEGVKQPSPVPSTGGRPTQVWRMGCGSVAGKHLPPTPVQTASSGRGLLAAKTQARTPEESASWQPAVVFALGFSTVPDVRTQPGRLVGGSWWHQHRRQPGAMRHSCVHMGEDPSCTQVAWHHPGALGHRGGSPGVWLPASPTAAPSESLGSCPAANAQVTRGSRELPATALHSFQGWHEVDGHVC